MENCEYRFMRTFDNKFPYIKLRAKEEAHNSPPSNRVLSQFESLGSRCSKSLSKLFQRKQESNSTFKTHLARETLREAKTKSLKKYRTLDNFKAAYKFKADKGRVCKVDLPRLEEAKSLYITDIFGVNDLDKLRSFRIRAVCTLGKENKPINFKYVKRGYTVIDCEAEPKDLKPLLPKLRRFIRKELSKGNVLIHDYDCSSVLPKLMLLYLTKYHKLSEQESFTTLKQARPSLKYKL